MRQIAHKQLERINQLLETRSINNDTFITGRLGLSFYYYHLYRVLGNTSYKHKTEELVEQVFANINSVKPTLIGAVLSTGGAGLGYVVNFFCREGFLQPDVNNELASLDEYLFNTACDLVMDDNIDYLHGAMGVVHYFNEKEETVPIAGQYRDALVEKICRRVVEEEGGSWFRNDLIKVNGRQVINFSLSHGLCGILMILADACKRSVHKALISKTLRDGIRFVLKHKMDVDFSQQEYSFFPFVITQDAREISAPNRLGWCYGDLNEVLLFYRAGKILDDPGLIRMADLIGMQCAARRDEQSTMVTVAGFCHGTAGLAQFSRTLYKESGWQVYLDGYEYWIEKTILLLDEELEKAGYAGKEHEYLEGLPGIALPLLSYISDTELRWSRFFLL